MGQMSNINRRSFLKTALAGASITALSPSMLLEKKAKKKPNIIVIMSDDMGFSDLGCYGGEIETPNLDKIGQEGVRFTHCYNAGRCCPSRGAIVTGLYSHRAGMGGMVTHNPQKDNPEGFRGELSSNAVTIAEALKPAGYHTYMTGKWHIAGKADLVPGSPNHNWPLQRGFDKFYGILSAGRTHWDPAHLMRGNKHITPDNDTEYKPKKKYHFIDAISDNTVEFLKQHKKEHDCEPFFFYVAQYAAHFPLHAHEEDVKKYEGKYDSGYEAVRNRRFEKAKRIGILPKNAKLSGIDVDLSEPVKNPKWQNRCMEVYAAMVDQMDQGVGKIVDELKAQGIYENTVIIYVQDNGNTKAIRGRRANMKMAKDQTSPDKWRREEPKGKDELHLGEAYPYKTRDGLVYRWGEDVTPGPDGTFILLGKEWANVSNMPFRRYKGETHEGGIATPLIFSWPKGVKKPGAIVNDLSHIIDMMPTCLELAGASYPKEFDGKKIFPYQGRSLVPVISNNGTTGDRTLYFEHRGNCSVRDKNYKLVMHRDNIWQDKWELYDMNLDRAETNDLAEKYPEKVKLYKEKWVAWAHENSVLPHKFLGTDAKGTDASIKLLPKTEKKPKKK